MISNFLILPNNKIDSIPRLNLKFKFEEQLNSNYKIFYDSFFEKKIKSKKKQFIFGGIYLRYLKSKNKNYNKNIDFPQVLKKTKNFDGNFLIINSTNNTIKIKTDSKGIFDLFYLKKNKKDIVISDSFEIIKKFEKNLNLDNDAILHSIISISKRPPKKHTFFKEIARLDLDQELILKGKKSKINIVKFEPEKIFKNLKEQNLLNEYNKNLNNFISEAGSKSNQKIVFMSSGWDSLMVIDKLCSFYKKNNIKPIIARLVFSDRSGVFNKYEILKAKKICKIYGLKPNFVTINYKYFEEYLKNLEPVGKKNMLLVSDAFFLHSRIIEEGIKKFKKGDFYSGEISDGAHNFGFSQYCTLLDHENNGYREYADKMMTYLFGPTFLKKVINKTYEIDPIFQILKKKLKIDTVIIKNKPSLKKTIIIFLESMFLCERRFPLNKEISVLVNKRAEKQLKLSFFENYLKNINIYDLNQIYSIYIYLYNKFHWQGSTVNTAFSYTKSKNLNMINMFWDKKIQKILSVMPEKYGRGLDIGYVKYPSKKLLSNKIDLEELNKVPHSYLSDYTNYDSNYELLFHSNMRKYIKNVFDKYNPAKFLDKKYFNISYIDKLIRKFYRLDKSMSSKEANTVYSFFCVSKILKDLNFKI